MVVGSRIPFCWSRTCCSGRFRRAAPTRRKRPIRARERRTITNRECTIPLPLGRPRDEWAKCLRDTLFLFAAERRLESFAMRPLSPGGVVGGGWTVAVEGTDSQLPEDGDTLTAKLRDDAEKGWLLTYDVEGDEGFDVRIPTPERDND